MPELFPNVRLQLINTPENVVLVRVMLTGVAEALGVEDGDLNDIRTAVTEACNNVVLHAYGGDPGPMDVEVQVTSGAVSVLVRDRGLGIDSRPGNEEDRGDGGGPADEDFSSAGIGLHVIQTLAHEVKFEQPAGGGTEVQMRFALPVDALECRTDELALATPTPSQIPIATTTQTQTAARVSIAPIVLARTVLPRLVSALAARAHFSTDRISDVQLLADALAAHAADALSGDRLSVGVNVGPREIELHIAPLLNGHAQRLLEESKLDGLGSVIEKLADRSRVSMVGAYETLTLDLVDLGGKL
jgi:serine/threonine-protein kinase RsbW